MNPPSAPLPITLGMMAKYWTPGQVKTRLASAVGDTAAAELHRLFFGQLAAGLSDVCRHQEIVFSPAAQIPAVMDTCSPSWRWTAQVDGDLGQRIAGWFDHAFGTTIPAVLIGADCPVLSPDDLRDAAAALQQADVVIGPAVDGGYYLIGLRPECWPGSRGIFDQIPWSTSVVLECTLRAAADLGLSVIRLDPKSDVDTIDDLDALHRSLSGSRDPAHVHLCHEIQRLTSP